MCYQRLEHPNVVRYIASKIVSKTLAMIWMEYVPGPFPAVTGFAFTRTVCYEF